MEMRHILRQVQLQPIHHLRRAVAPKGDGAEKLNLIQSGEKKGKRSTPTELMQATPITSDTGTVLQNVRVGDQPRPKVAGSPSFHTGNKGRPDGAEHTALSQCPSSSIYSVSLALERVDAASQIF